MIWDINRSTGPRKRVKKDCDVFSMKKKLWNFFRHSKCRTLETFAFFHLLFASFLADDLEKNHRRQIKCSPNTFQPFLPFYVLLLWFHNFHLEKYIWICQLHVAPSIENLWSEQSMYSELRKKKSSVVHSDNVTATVNRWEVFHFEVL